MMSIIDRFIAAVTPPESEEARLEARAKATHAATSGDWLGQILQHHMDLEDAFADVKAASDAASRTAALKQLGIVLTGHAIAEEAVIYPALADDGEKAHATAGYEEQAMVKVQMALLESLDPMSQDFIDKLEPYRRCGGPPYVCGGGELVSRPQGESDCCRRGTHDAAISVRI